MSTTRQCSAEKAGFRYFELPLACGANGREWVCPQRGTILSVERAVLSHLERDGWRGFWGEGGLLLNLIKCMSFPELPLHHRLTYVEAIYAQNIAFESEKVSVKRLLDALPDPRKRPRWTDWCWQATMTATLPSTRSWTRTTPHLQVTKVCAYWWTS